ncbi:hypothetical protein LguiA_018923 [Lonicera macranthoides]
MKAFLAILIVLLFYICTLSSSYGVPISRSFISIQQDQTIQNVHREGIMDGGYNKKDRMDMEMIDYDPPKAHAPIHNPIPVQVQVLE